MGPRMPPVPDGQGEQAHCHASRTVSSDSRQISARPHRHRRRPATFRYLVTAVDRFTRWPEAFPVQDITAETVAKAFLYGWIARFGCPETITTDQGRQFESELFRKLGHFCGFQRSRTTAYHPESNGLVERFCRRLKASFMCCGNKWTDSLAPLFFGIRAAFKEDLQASNAELVYDEGPGWIFCFRSLGTTRASTLNPGTTRSDEHTPSGPRDESPRRPHLHSQNPQRLNARLHQTRPPPRRTQATLHWPL